MNLYNLYSQPEELDLHAELGSLINQFKNLVWHNAQGYIHRDGDKPAIIFANGRQDWYKDGLHHRDGDKPAVIYADGAQEWWQHGRRHRDDGPAIIYGDNVYDWYKEGFHYEPTEEELEAWQEKQKQGKAYEESI